MRKWRAFMLHLPIYLYIELMYATRRKVQRVSIFTLTLLFAQILSPFFAVLPVYAQDETETTTSSVSSSESSTSSESSSSSAASSSSTTSAESQDSVSSESSSSSAVSSESSSSSAAAEEIEEEQPAETEEKTTYADSFIPSGIKTYATNGVVQTGVKYVFPLDNGVSIEFTKLPEVSSPVTVKQIILSEAQVKELNAASNVAYDFTTDMVDGSFEYVITLPNKAGEKAQVVYAETVADLASAKTLETIEVSEDNKVTFEADHFTVFVVTSFEEVQTTPNTSYNGIWDAFGTGATIVQAPSGTDGISSSNGDNHAKVTVGAFTRWDGYKAVFPTGGYDTRVDVYLDMSVATGSVDKRLDYSSAISNQAGNHRRDFIFHLGTNPTVAGQWFVSATNNSIGWPGNPANNPITINTSGWYTLEHQFRNVGDVLVVTMNIYQAGNPTPVGTWVRSDASDVISSVIGGNRYGWFIDTASYKLDWFAIDNASIEYNSLPINNNNIVVTESNWQGWTPAVTVGGQVDILSTGDAKSGSGVLNLTTQADVQDRASIGRSENVALNSIYKLSYSTKRGAGFGNEGNASYRILIDADGNTATTTDVAYLIHEPYWQNGGSPDAAPVQNDVWQTWSVNTGLFWASIPGGNAVAGLVNGAGGPPFYTLQNVLALHPNARVIGLNVGIGSYNLNYDIQVDNVVFSYNNGASIEVNAYDFEPLAPQAPVVTIVDPTPAENSYVRGIITGRVTATDEEGMGSYYLRFWKDAFEVAGGGTLVGNCQEAPGAGLLGLSIDKTCAYDTRTNPDGLYVFSAQVQDSDIMWGQALRQFYVDNTRPTIAFNNPSVPNQAEDSVFVPSVTATDNTVLKRVAINLYNGANTTFLAACGSTPADSSLGVNNYTFTCNLDAGALADGVYTLRASATDEAGNVQTTTATFEVDTTPVVDIIEATSRILGGAACGIGSAWSDDGLKVEITNWKGTYQLQGRYFIAGGSFGGWFDLASSGTLSVTGDTASFFASNYGDSPAGAAGWEVRVVNTADLNTAISNVDSLSYNIVTDPNTFVCNGAPQTLGWVAQSVPVACGGVTSSFTVSAVWAAFDNATQYEYSVTTPGIPVWNTFVGSNQYSGVFNQGAGVYTFKVRATQPYESQWSTDCAITYDPVAPSVPVLTSPSNGAVLGTNNFDFEWEDSTDLFPVTYEFQSSMNPAEVGGVLTTDLEDVHSSLSTSMLSSTGKADGTWYWQVRAKDTAGNYSAWSEIWNVTLDTVAPEFTMQDMSIDEGTTPDVLGMVLTNPESLTVSCTPSTITDVTVSQPNASETTVVTCEVTDAAGHTTSDSATLTINNVVPTINLEPEDSVINTNTPTVLSLAISGGNAPTSYTWSCTNGLNGANNAVTFSSTGAGSFECTATVTDIDGDTASDTVSVVVTAPTTPAPQQGGNNNANNNNVPNGIGDAGDVAGASTDEELAEEDGIEELDPQVLGAGSLVCEQEYAIGGKVFIDLNNNNIQDAGEQGASNVRIELAFRNIDGNFVLAEIVTTNDSGEWTTQGCPATYRLRILENSLPDNTTLVGDDEQLVTVASSAVAGLTFVLASSSAPFNWLPLIIVFLILAGILATVFYNRRRA